MAETQGMTVPLQGKTLDIQMFRQIGLLQEVNRLFFHPLGLALVVGKREDGTEYLHSIQDASDDPEGIVFDWAAVPEPHAKARRVEAFRFSKLRERERMGFRDGIQPLPDA
jgi:hypothetical protein